VSKKAFTEVDEFGRPVLKETHAIAEAQQKKNKLLKEAFGISSTFVEGSSFYKEAEDPKKFALLPDSDGEGEKKKKKKKRSPSSSSSSSSSDSEGSDQENKKGRRSRFELLKVLIPFYRKYLTFRKKFHLRIR
jgi:serine/arginine repetitive matrix protein 2